MKPIPAPLLAPWAITAEGLQLVLAVWSRGELFPEARQRALQARDGEPLDNTRAVIVRDGVAVIPVSGPLMRHASLFSAVSGATSYATIRKDVQVALDDPRIKAIVLDINSPGGEVDGCNELSDALFEARARKPVVAYIGGMGASAAYWLCSAASKIVCSETALIGSIGVRSAIVDNSARDAKDGVRSIEIISSQSPAKRDTPVDDEVIARAQRHVDDLAAVFLKTVARNRGVSVAVVAESFGQGDVFVGQRAIDAGLADTIGNLEQVIADQAKASAAKRPLAAATATSASVKAPKTTKERTMSKKNPFRAEGAPEPMPQGAADDEPAGAEDEDKVTCQHCKGKGTMPDESKCEVCAGSGKVAKAQAADDEEDNNASDDKPEDEKEKAALRALARKHGLSATASRAEILLAAATAPSAQSIDKLVAKRVAEEFAAQERTKAKAEAKRRAEDLVARAMRGGYAGDSATADEDRAALVALAEINFAAAERSVAHFLKNADTLGERVTHAGAPAGNARPTAQGDMVVRRMGAVRIVKHGVSLSAEAKALAAKAGISYEAALDRVVAQRPELYDAYLNQRV